MSTKNKTNESSDKLEKLYKKYFYQGELSEVDDESISLLQPSPLQDVESFTTYGVTEELLINKEE